MTYKSNILVLLPALVLGIIGILSTFLFKDFSGLFTLLVGFAMGFFLTEFYVVPRLLDGWAKSDLTELPEQIIQKQVQNRSQLARSLIILIGLILAAVLRNYFRDIMPFVVPLGLGGLTAFFLRVGWLKYKFFKAK